MQTVFIPFTNFSLSQGRLNSGALVRADGLAHIGHGYAAPSPLTATTATFGTAEAAPFRPMRAHLNPNQSGGLLSRNMYFFQNNPLGGTGLFFQISGVGTAPPWTVTARGTVTNLTDSEAGQFASFGLYEIFAAGHDDEVQIFDPTLALGTTFIDCFTSTDKPRAKYVTSIGERLLIGNISNTGSAGGPDPNTSLLWWGATDDARVMSNPIADPDKASDFQHLADDYGDISGLAGGKKVAYILKDRCVYVMTLTNTIFGYGFDLISTGIGTRHSQSIAGFGDEVYFWSNLGPVVIRANQVLMLSDGYWTQRGFFMESPAHPNFNVLGTAVDSNNGLILWHVEYTTNVYNYDGVVEPPTETIEDIQTGQAIVAYSILSNQFSFLWRRPESINLPLVNFMGVEPLDEEWFIRAMVDGIPFDQQTMPLSGVGFVAHRATPTPIQGPQVLVSGFEAGGGASQPVTDPERIIDASPFLATGMVQISAEENVTISAVRPIVRGRRALPVPTMRVWVKSSPTPFDVERIHGPFDSIGDYSARNGWIRTPGVAQGNFIAIELEIASWSGTPWAQNQAELSYLLEDIEGVEVQIKPGGRAT